MTATSRLGKEGLGSDTVGPVDRPNTDQSAVSLDGVVASTATSAPGGGRGLPIDDQPIGLTSSGPFLDSPGDQPLDVELVGGVTLGDEGGAGVLDPGRVDPVDGVGPDKAGSIAVDDITADDKIARQGRPVQEGKESETGNKKHEVLASHDGQPTAPDLAERLIIPRSLKIAAVAFAVVVAAALAFAVFEPIQVLPRTGLAPGYALTSQSGEIVTSETNRGAVTLYTFAPTGCGANCDRLDTAMREVGDRVAAEVDLGSVNFVQVTIALDASPSTDELARAAARSGADGERWQWIGGAEADVRTIVGQGFEVFFEPEADDGTVRFDPALILVDGSGVVRGDYRYLTVADDADKIVHHVEILAEELRYADGPAGVAYEAAHLFLCYP